MTQNAKLTIRLSPEDMATLKSHAARAKLSQSAYLRHLIRGYVPKAYPPEAFYTLLERLNEDGGRLDAEALDSLVRLQKAVTAPEKIEDG